MTRISGSLCYVMMATLVQAKHGAWSTFNVLALNWSRLCWSDEAVHTFLNTL